MKKMVLYSRLSADSRIAVDWEELERDFGSRVVIHERDKFQGLIEAEDSVLNEIVERYPSLGITDIRTYKLC